MASEADAHLTSVAGGELKMQGLRLAWIVLKVRMPVAVDCLLQIFGTTGETHGNGE